MPKEEDVILSIPVEDIVNSLPSYDDRRAMLARDPLASVDGFRMLVLATYEYIFGMRVCAFCPDCAIYDNPCQDIFGSNAMPEGASFGRIDAGYSSVEAQKSTGSLHAHSQLFVQCLHQHTPLAEILSRLKGKHGEVSCLVIWCTRHTCADKPITQSRRTKKLNE
jgi:hypothetical protein